MADYNAFPISASDDISPRDPAEIVLQSDQSANHKLMVTTPTTLYKKGGFPSYDFDGPASGTPTYKLGLQRGDKVHLLSSGANNHDRILTIASVTSSTITTEEDLLSGDGAVEFDFELIRRKG